MSGTWQRQVDSRFCDFSFCPINVISRNCPKGTWWLPNCQVSLDPSSQTCCCVRLLPQPAAKAAHLHIAEQDLVLAFLGFHPRALQFLVPYSNPTTAYSGTPVGQVSSWNFQPTTPTLQNIQGVSSGVATHPMQLHPENSQAMNPRSPGSVQPYHSAPSTPPSALGVGAPTTTLAPPQLSLVRATPMTPPVVSPRSAALSSERMQVFMQQSEDRASVHQARALSEQNIFIEKWEVEEHYHVCWREAITGSTQKPTCKLSSLFLRQFLQETAVTNLTLLAKEGGGRHYQPLTPGHSFSTWPCPSSRRFHDETNSGRYPTATREVAAQG